MNDLRIGIIGFGGAGQAHRHYFSCIPGCHVTKIFDPKPAGQERASHFRNIAVVGRLEDFWSDLDVVSVCSPDSSHADYIIEALERSLHVLCEKPLTDSVIGIQRILAAERSCTGVLAVLHQMRFVPLFRRMKEVTASGTLGRLHLMEGYYVHDLRERAFIYDDWRATEQASPLVYAGCHFVDLLRWIAEEEVVEIEATANHLAFERYPGADTVLATLRFSSGVLGQVTVAFASAGPQDHSVRLYGTERTIDNNVLFRRPGIWERTLHRPLILQPELFVRGEAQPRRILQHLRTNLPAWLLDRLFLLLRSLAPDANSSYGARHYPLRLYEHSLASVGAVADFIEAIRHGREPLCTASEAARTVLACLAGNESIEMRRAVTVPSLETVCEIT